MKEAPQTTPLTAHETEIDLHQFIRILWEGKWIIGSITLGLTGIAVIVALMLPNIYRAEALLAPSDQDGASGLSALTSQYAGLASIAGINLSPGATDKTTLGLETLKSRKFISEFIERRDILIPLMAAKTWDVETKELVIDADIYDPKAEKWVRDTSPPKKTIPSLQEASDEFRQIMSVSQDKTSGFVTLKVDHYSPILAKRWVEWLIEDVNSTILNQDVVQAERAIAYLNEQIESTSIAGLKNVFFRLIEEQMKTIVLANVSTEYLFSSIDPAVVAEEKIMPDRKLICMISAFLAFILGILVYLPMYSWRAKSPRRQHA